MTEAVSNGYMARALAAAERAGAAGEVPVGAVIVDSEGTVLAVAENRMRRDNDPTAHAEIVAIRAVCAARGSERIGDCDLYVTLEPCAMCAAAISFARLRRLYFAASDVKGGGVENGPVFFSQATCHHAPEVYSGIDEMRASEMLRAFFAARR
ncbi:MAG: nucleoside deaminase [Pseudomonadota bacterium]